MPTEEERIAFNHVVAGHAGMDSNLTGELVIKPCDPSEIAFYNSLGGHEGFASVVPFFVGELAVAKDQSAAFSLLATQNGQATPTQVGSTPLSTLAVIPEARTSSAHSDESLHTVALTPTSAKRISWKPSDGKKKNTGLAIVLENVATGFKCPNILDVKLGARLWADDAPASKRQRLEDVSKTTTSGTLGFRIAGMKLWHGEPNGTETTLNGRKQVDDNIELRDGYTCYTKHYGRTVTADTVKDGFVAYFGASKPTTNGKVRFRHRRTRSVVRRMVQRLRNIETVLYTEESRMYSASILMVYEGDEDALERAYQDEKAREHAAVKESERLGAHENLPGRSKPRTEDEQQQNGDEEDGNSYEDDDDEDEEERPKIEDARLIDFAHAQWTPGQGRDENALQGIRSVIKILDEIAGNT